MRMDHPPRAHLNRPSLWIDEPGDDSPAPLENAVREDKPSLRDGEHTEEVYSLLEKHGEIQGLLVQLSALHRTNVVHPK